MNKFPDLNQRSSDLLDSIEPQSSLLNIECHSLGEARLFDFGVDCPGGLMAGLELARVCSADLARIELGQMAVGQSHFRSVSFISDHPLAACMGAQYAGWPLQVDDYFAMGSGPIRSLRGEEKILTEYSLHEKSDQGVVCLETGKIPTESVARQLAEEAGVLMKNLLVAVAPTRSIAGSIQVVARSLETCMHKLHELGFDLREVVSGIGSAPIPPVASDDLKGIGLTNDAILFGGKVDLWVRSGEDRIRQYGPQTPSSASPDYGTPFYDLFRQNNFDFYKIDPHLFSPAQVTFHSLESGNSMTFGSLDEKLLTASFGNQASTS